MKKSLIALALMGAFSGAAVAQSNVTLYGILDVNYMWQELPTVVGTGTAAPDPAGERGRHQQRPPVGQPLGRARYRGAGWRTERHLHPRRRIQHRSRHDGPRWPSVRSSGLGRPVRWLGCRGRRPSGHVLVGHRRLRHDRPRRPVPDRLRPRQRRQHVLLDERPARGQHDRLCRRRPWAGFKGGVGYSFNVDGAESRPEAPTTPPSSLGANWTCGPFFAAITYDVGRIVARRQQPGPEAPADRRHVGYRPCPPARWLGETGRTSRPSPP